MGESILQRALAVADIASVEALATEQLAALNPVIAQAIAMASHANAFFKGKVKEPRELVGTHSAFHTTFEMTFDRLGPGERPYALADGTAPWLRKLQKEEVPRVRLIMVPLSLEKASRVAGLPDPRWGFMTEGDVGTELWCPNWTIRIGINPKDEPAPWKVSWQAEKSERSFYRGDLPLSEAMQKLDIAIRDMGPFVGAMGSDLERATYEELTRAVASKTRVPRLEQYPELFEAELFDKPARRLGVIASLALGLFIAAGWKDRRIGHEQVQDAFDAARAEVWKTGIAAIQSTVNTLAA